MSELSNSPLGLASSDKKGEISDANLLVSPKELEVGISTLAIIF
jgi:hypothetical protein